MNKALVASIVLALGFTLSACSGSGTPVAAEPTIVATTPAAVAVPKPGDTITTMDQVNAAKAAGLGFYPLTTGGIVFDKTQPLPDAIKADITAPVVQAVTQSEGGATEAVWQAVASASDNASTALGKNVIVIYGALASLTPGGEAAMYYSAYGAGGDSDLGGGSVSTSRDAAIAFTQTWISGQPDATNYEVVVAN